MHLLPHCTLQSQRKRRLASQNRWYNYIVTRNNNGNNTGCDWQFLVLTLYSVNVIMMWVMSQLQPTKRSAVHTFSTQLCCWCYSVHVVRTCPISNPYCFEKYWNCDLISIPNEDFLCVSTGIWIFFNKLPFQTTINSLLFNACTDKCTTRMRINSVRIESKECEFVKHMFGYDFVIVHNVIKIFNLLTNTACNSSVELVE